MSTQAEMKKLCDDLEKQFKLLRDSGYDLENIKITTKEESVYDSLRGGYYKNRRE